MDSFQFKGVPGRLAIDGVVDIAERISGENLHLCRLIKYDSHFSLLMHVGMSIKTDKIDDMEMRYMKEASEYLKKL
jgi:hypothetical protein